MNTIQITALEYGKSFIPESMVFQNGSKEINRSIVFMFYLLETQNRKILVDTGCVTMPGFEMTDFIGPVSALKKVGLTPLDITDVIVTHAHHDHIECLSLYKNATVYIQEKEYAAGKGYFPEACKACTFSESCEVCPGVTVLKIGGHTEGSCIVELQTENGITVIAGDECYAKDCLTKQIPTGSSFCVEQSTAFVQKYSDSKYRVLLCHEK